MKKLIEELKIRWDSPKLIKQKEDIEILFNCVFNNEPAIIENNFLDIPQDIIDFWSITQNAFLFVDIINNQWGLEILNPLDAMTETKNNILERPEDFYKTDLIIGRFIGDSDLLFICCDKTSLNFGHIYVASPIDEREDWYHVSSSFEQFLTNYFDCNGKKFWEISRFS
ncbi:MAG: SMI1/KNR4 family protein [Thermoflexibacter sp.]|jgi:hypothetical protein|nr:SMI1/KNR4 family protein [Thermoflexibacter sp.]